jgi:HD domain
VRIAQTNIQLYNQLRRRGLDRGELVLIHRAYELAARVYSGYYQGDGKPFVSHGVGVASILAELEQPADILAVGLVHAVYENGDFGDGEQGAASSRRALVREAVGPHVEQLVFRFTQLRLHPDTIERDRDGLAGLDEPGRRLQVVAIVDHLEKYVDLGVLYFGDNAEIVEWTDRIGPDLIELAGELGEPELAQMVSAAFVEAKAEARNVPIELRPSDGRRHLKLVVPPSCYRRPQSGALRPPS